MCVRVLYSNKMAHLRRDKGSWQIPLQPRSVSMT